MRNRIMKGMVLIFVLTEVIAGCGVKEEPMPDMRDAEIIDAARDKVMQDHEESTSADVPDLADYEDGTYAGTFIVEDLDILLPLYLADINGDKEIIQEYTNDEDSAVLFKYGAQYVAADHVEQAFARLGEAVPGITKAEIEWLDGRKISYICTRSCLGLNNGYLYDDTGRRLTHINAGGLTTYTCTDTWKTVTMVFWQPDETAA